IKVKKLLLKRFIEYCKNKKMTYIKTDSFEFMENHDFFEDNGFKIVSKEDIGNGLMMFWRRFDLTIPISPPIA
ncbi:MAG: hypothetical protein KJ721_00810, partial [Nanoarchaeota archaeon]|nr:hypothetical protein [Nanoarchaeota archaeon]